MKNGKNTPEHHDHHETGVENLSEETWLVSPPVLLICHVRSREQTMKGVIIESVIPHPSIALKLM